MTRDPCDLYTVAMAAAAMTGGPFPGFITELSMACRPTKAAGCQRDT